MIAVMLKGRNIVWKTMVAAVCQAALFLFSPPSAHALSYVDADEVMVIGARLDGRLDDNPQSGYNQFVADVMGNIDEAQFQQLPMVRAIATFAREERVCLLPTSRDILANILEFPADELISSHPIDIVSSHFFFRNGDTIDTDIFGKADKHVVKQSGLNLKDIFGDQLKAAVTHVPEMQIALRMLQAGRVDAMYAWYPDVMIISARTGIEPPVFSADVSDIRIETTLTCKRFDGVESLMAKFNARLAFLRDSNKLREILGPYARLPKR